MNMKAKDLQIHDWVSADGRPVQVVGLYILGGDTIEVLAPFMSFSQSYTNNIVVLSNGGVPLSKVNPLPLSIEILKSFGFEKNENYVYVSKEGDNTLCLIALSDCYVVDGKFQIHNTHELQQLMRQYGLKNKANDTII